MNRNALLSEKVRKHIQGLKINYIEWNQFLLIIQETIQIYEERSVEVQEILNQLNWYIHEGIVTIREFDYYVIALNKIRRMEVVTVYNSHYDDKLYRATKQMVREVRNRYYLEHEKSKENIHEVLINTMVTVVQYCEEEEKSRFLKNILDLNEFFNIGIQQKEESKYKE
ncbi:hypothetical protein BAQ47_03255 [Bacillus tropicus]|uniref:hypothetical protein n=1 Tax=Bacillus tropicus TaxID=2026188 RepID=UPI0008FDB444|nr:hypothetical protein [Bacillus tropicus]OJE31679.1 hypothetical protein BAQ47_03255 [Bacillus tropicus]